MGWEVHGELSGAWRGRTVVIWSTCGLTRDWCISTVDRSWGGLREDLGAVLRAHSVYDLSPPVVSAVGDINFRKVPMRFL